jgi:hypothetical protein
MPEPKETKAEAFARLAEKRVPNAANAIRLVGQLGSSNYEASAQGITEIQQFLQTSLDEAMTALGVKARSGPTAPDYSGPEWKLADEAMTALIENDTDVALAKLKAAFGH